MDKTFYITIYHNPKCGTSRNTLAAIRSAGYEPEVVEYMQAGWTLPQLNGLLAKMGVAARDILRAKEPLAEELGLTNPGVPEDKILAAMVAHPVLVNRPIVVSPQGARLCRPAEEVLPLLDKAAQMPGTAATCDIHYKNKVQ